jgi:heme O synthase-like polyprenyltransferase
MKAAAPTGIIMVRDYLELTKPRITLLILICTAIGHRFGCVASFHWAICFTLS